MSGLVGSRALSAEWAPTAGRILLGVVFFWSGYHELGLAVCLTGCKNQRLVLRN